MAHQFKTVNTKYGDIHFFLMGLAMGARIEDSLIDYQSARTEPSAQYEFKVFQCVVLSGLDDLMDNLAKQLLSAANKDSAEAIRLQQNAAKMRALSLHLTTVKKGVNRE